MSAGQFGFLFLGIDKGMPAGLASLVIQLQVAFTVVLAVIFLGERPRPAQLAGGALAFAGIGIIAAGRAEAVPLARCRSASALRSAGASATSRAARPRPHPLGLLVWSSLVPPVPLLALSLLTERGAGGHDSTRPASSRCCSSWCSRRSSASARGRRCSPATPPRRSCRSRCSCRCSASPRPGWRSARSPPGGARRRARGARRPRAHRGVDRALARTRVSPIMRSRRVALAFAAAFAALRRRRRPPHVPGRRRAHAGAALRGGPHRRRDRPGRPRLGARHRITLRRARAAQGRASARPARARQPTSPPPTRLPQLRRDERGDRRGRGRAPGASCSQFSIGTSYEGRRHVGRQDLRQRRRPTRTSPRCCSPRPARPRAPDGRDGAVPAARAHADSTAPTRGSRTWSTPARSGSSPT